MHTGWFRQALKAFGIRIKGTGRGGFEAAV